MHIGLIFVGIVLFYLLSCIRIINEYERAVIFRLGHVLDQTKGPGIIVVLWPIDRAVKVSLQIVTLDVPPQDIITKDNVSAKINAVAYFRVMDPIKATVQIQNYFFAISQMAQTTLRSVIGEIELDEFDPLSLHALAVDGQGRVVGTGRLLPDGHIGRMAVLREARGRGVGSALLRSLMQAARARGDREVALSAQTHAIPFYERFGFVAEGGQYDDAGIPHRRMRLAV